jgi:hypothetical protein
MALEVVESKTAIECFKSHPSPLWYKAARDAATPADHYAGSRLKQQQLLIPFLKPSFQMEQTDAVFAVGSCFARNLEQQLIRRNIPVLSYTEAFDGFERNTQSSDLAQRNFISKFNTLSMLQQFQWSLEPEVAFSRDAFVTLDDDRAGQPNVLM